MLGSYLPIPRPATKASSRSTAPMVASSKPCRRRADRTRVRTNLARPEGVGRARTTRMARSATSRIEVGRRDASAWRANRGRSAETSRAPERGEGVCGSYGASTAASRLASSMVTSSGRPRTRSVYTQT